MRFPRRLACILACACLAAAPAKPKAVKPAPRKPAASAKKTTRRPGAHTPTTKKPVTKKPVARMPIAKKPVFEGLVNVSALAPFLESLGQTRNGEVVRVLHFGDSHTAADMWTGEIRARLQARFGDAGPGLVLPGFPWRGYPRPGMHFLTGRNWEAASLRNPATDGQVGLTGASLTPSPTESFWVQASFADFRIQTLETDPQDPPACMEADPAAPQDPPPAVPLELKAETPLASGALLRIRGPQAPLPLQERELGITLPPTTRLLGVELLSGQPGVVYDELGLNGAELLDLERWSPELRRLLLQETRPDLIVLAYGTNEAGHMSLDLQDYLARVKALLGVLHEESGAPILLVGPPDRSARSKRNQAAIQAQESAIIRALRAAALDTGSAFWDTREAMGGPGTMLKWRRSGMAQKDYVHYTGPGYRRLADLLSDALLAAYEPYEKAKP